MEQTNSMQNWITSYTKEDIDYVLSWIGKVSDNAICRELNITQATLKEIVNVYIKPMNHGTD